MKQTFFMLKNLSGSSGEYVLNKGDEPKTVYPNEKISLTQKPFMFTQNVSISMYTKEVEDRKKITNDKEKK